MALVEGGDLRPTAPRIAQRAGVSVRSVFQHFDDLPTLYAAVVQRVVERLAGLVVTIEPDQPLDDRIAAFVRHRADLLEAVTPFRRAAAVHGPFAPSIGQAVARGASFLRAQVERTFAPELARLGADDRRDVVDALAATSSWGTWDALRVDGGCSPARASTALARIVRALLTAAPNRR
ncbi:MAG TPA: TetR/AcrR family transcriptional regulator [Acidimicrobiales bacterium]